MKDHFLRLFDYDKHTNLLIIKLIINAGGPEKPVQLMAHLLAAQQVWLTRCKGEPFTGVLWPDWKADTFTQTIEENSKGWIGYLNTLTPGGFDKRIRYKNSKGEAFENKLNDILTHVINHGTHHRAQVGQYLKTAGTELPFTDYIFYVRQLNNY